MAIQRNQPPKIQLGKCPFCEVEVLTVVDNQPKLNEKYSDFWIRLSDGSKMKVAICKECKKGLTKAKAESVITAHQDFWAKGIEKVLDEKISELQTTKEQQVNFYKNLNLLSYGLKEKDIE